MKSQATRHIPDVLALEFLRAFGETIYRSPHPDRRHPSGTSAFLGFRYWLAPASSWFFCQVGEAGARDTNRRYSSPQTPPDLRRRFVSTGGWTCIESAPQESAH